MGIFSKLGVGRAADALFGDPTKGIKKATAQQIALQREGLDYAKSVDAPLIDYRDKSLDALYGFYDPNNPDGQQQFIDQAQQSPFYQRGVEVGEQGVLRNQAATGGLRTGDTQTALAGFNQDYLNSIVNQNLQGLQQFSRPALSTNSISNQYGNIGATQAAGTTAANQAKQDQTGQLLNLGLTAAGLFSDSRLKKNIKKIGEVKGVNWYSWEWNDIASKLGLSGASNGVIADEFKESRPELLSEKDGYLQFNYEAFLNG